MSAITFLNMSGDVTIIFDEHNRQQILDLVTKKMQEGYTFFTTKSILGIQRRVKLTDKNLPKVDNVVIKDPELEKLTFKALQDSDVAKVVASGAAELATVSSSGAIEADKRCKDANEVVHARQTVAVRPVRGG